MGRRILVVDDEPSLVASLSYSLGRAGFQVRIATDGPGALEVAQEIDPDLIVLDVMLPGLDGFEVCRRLRARTTAPILMLTARDDPMDRVVGLEVGADDYVTKPFSVRELVARINAQLRRASILSGEAGPTGRPPSDETIDVGPLVVDAGRRIATLAGQRLALKRREFDLLAYLALNAGIVLSRDRLLSEVWADELGGHTRTVDVHIRRLRRHLEADPEAPRFLETVRGVGYVLRRSAS
ncbi:MAG TPA: response regulator transcription factor [Chloroflexota bacterium]|jgi:two-component system alkaline phosphatase synthesis response regulator PhoP